MILTDLLFNGIEGFDKKKSSFVGISEDFKNKSLMEKFKLVLKKTFDRKVISFRYEIKPDSEKYYFCCAKRIVYLLGFYFFRFFKLSILLKEKDR